jgi:hypothetical protein
MFVAALSFSQANQDVPDVCIFTLSACKTYLVGVICYSHARHNPGHGGPGFQSNLLVGEMMIALSLRVE